MCDIDGRDQLFQILRLLNPVQLHIKSAHDISENPVIILSDMRIAVFVKIKQSPDAQLLTSSHIHAGPWICNFLGDRHTHGGPFVPLGFYGHEPAEQRNKACRYGKPQSQPAFMSGSS